MMFFNNLVRIASSSNDIVVREKMTFMTWSDVND